MITNLLHFHSLATRADLSEARWYWIARAQCKAEAARLGVSFRSFVWAVAALSPMCNWDVNVRGVVELAETGETHYGLGANRAKALRCLAGDLSALRGQKVERFAKSILNPNRYAAEVVVDTWAIRAADGRWIGDVKTLSAQEYFDLACEYREAARQVGMKAGEFQAVVWVVVRRLGRKHGQLTLDLG